MKTIINFLKNIFAVDSFQSSLEKYIVTGNPQSSGDVDRLEREYYRKQFNGKN